MTYLTNQQGEQDTIWGCALLSNALPQLKPVLLKHFSVKHSTGKGSL